MNTKSTIAVVMLILISGSAFLTGCSNNSKKLAFRHFEQNELLNSEEKAYAKRCLLYMYQNYTLEGNVTITPEMLVSQDYEVWGLGAYRDFNPAEKAYINEIHNYAKMWKIYKTLNMDDLSLPEKEYLEEVHARYGPNPSFEEYISVGKERFLKEDKEAYQMAIKMVNSLFDLDHIDDFSIILMRRLEHQAVI